MSPTYWSTRETLERAAAQQTGRSADITLGLAEMEQELGWGDVLPGLCGEHQRAVNRLAELHLLIDHLVANLRGGHGVPATPAPPAPPAGKRQDAAREAPALVAEPQQRPAPAACTPAPAAPPATLRARSDGLLTRREAIVATGYSDPGFAFARNSGRIPAPRAHEGRSPLWHPEQLQGITPLHGGGRGRA